MPTNSERREVAARLREKYREKYCPGVWQVQSVNDQIWMYLKDLEACLPDGYSAFNVLADLIEPEERTCRDEGSSETFRCTRCVTFIRRDAVTDGFRPNPIRYCPCCGAKVVKQ